MTKHGVVVVPEDAVAAAAGRHFSFPPPRTGGDSCKKQQLAGAQIDLGTLSPIVEDPDRAVMTDEVSTQSRKHSMLCLSSS